MAVADGVYGAFLDAMGDNDQAFDLTADTLDVALVNDTHAPDFNTDSQFSDLDNEVTGTGWASGGVALVSNTWVNASGYSTLDANDVSESGTTLTNAEAAVVIDDTLVNDLLISMTDFGSPASTSSGTFGIQWDANGIWRIDYIP